jgi:hypothetical protein
LNKLKQATKKGCFRLFGGLVKCTKILQQQKENPARFRGGRFFILAGDLGGKAFFILYLLLLYIIAFNYIIAVNIN